MRPPAVIEYTNAAAVHCPRCGAAVPLVRSRSGLRRHYRDTLSGVCPGSSEVFTLVYLDSRISSGRTVIARLREEVRIGKRDLEKEQQRYAALEAELERTKNELRSATRAQRCEANSWRGALTAITRPKTRVVAIPKDVRAAVLLRDGRRCRYCGKEIPESDQLQIDHCLPRSHGGTNDLTNLVVACYKCNHSKGAKPPWHPLVVRMVGAMRPVPAP